MKKNKRIGIIDADLVDHGTRHPNLALMKISGFYKEKIESGEVKSVKLITEKSVVEDYDKSDFPFDEVFVSKVFDFTETPFDKYIGSEITPEHPEKIVKNKRKTVVFHFGGTGFFWDKSPKLEPEIEFHMPDYDLYKDWVEEEQKKSKKPDKYRDYTDFSIGFTTRGCFRHCKFCINKNCDKAVRHSKISDFLDVNRSKIYLWDDNVLAYPGWREIFKELAATKKYFQFRQGLDFRLMTDEKAELLGKSKWYGDFIFAFDNLEDRNVIEPRLKIWRKHNPKKGTKFYLFCGFKQNPTDFSGLYKDVVSIFERIKILMQYGCIGYVMRHEDYKNSPLPNIYVQIARWCNQQQFYKKMSFWEFVYRNQSFWEQHTLKITNRPDLKSYDEFLIDYKKGYYCGNIKICKPLQTLLDFLEKFKENKKELLDLFNLKMITTKRILLDN